MDRQAVLKRIYFYLDDADKRAADELSAESYPSFSEFVRIAVQEKLDRQMVANEVRDMASEVSHAVAELRQEMARARADMLADNELALNALKAEALESLRKNEEATRVFILALTQALGGGKPAPSPAARGRREFDPDAPMAIPG